MSEFNNYSSTKGLDQLLEILKGLKKNVSEVLMRISKSVSSPVNFI